MGGGGHVPPGGLDTVVGSDDVLEATIPIPSHGTGIFIYILPSQTNKCRCICMPYMDPMGLGDS